MSLTPDVVNAIGMFFSIGVIMLTALSVADLLAKQVGWGGFDKYKDVGDDR